jgi:hypothetical protein
MKKLERKDIRGPALYEPIRADLRARVVELKKRRRVTVGPVVTLVFENRATMIFQIEEMLRAESIRAEDKIGEEIAVYNSLLPDDGELSATLFVEITEQADIRPRLEQLVGLEDHLWLEVAGARIPGRFEGGRSDGFRISSVQYVRFAVPAAQAAALAAGPARIVIDHPNYRHQAELAEPTRQELAQDLS